jgi:outer membrane protein assembly factor BamB
MRHLRAQALAYAAGGILLIGAACGEITSKPPADGVLLWRTQIHPISSPLGTPAADGEHVYAVLGGVQAFRAADGAMLWRGPLDTYAPENLVTGGGRVFAAEAAVTAYNASTGSVVWRTRPDANASLGRATLHDGVLYFGTSSHRVYALDAATGEQRWSTDVGPEWEHPAVVRGIAVSGDTVYAAVEQWRAANGYRASGWVVALDGASGDTLWRFQSGFGEDRDVFGSSPTVAGRLLLVSDVSSNAVVALDRFTGEEVWRFNGLPGYVGIQEAPLVRGDRVYAASGDTRVYALELQTGRQVWSRALPAANEAFALCGNQLFVNYGGVAVLDPETGGVLWSGYDGDEFTISGFAVANNRIFVLGNVAAYAFRCD